MLFKFKSKACADLIMLEADGRRLLRAMTGDAPAKGIVPWPELPQALARLEAAVADDEAQRQARRQEAIARGEEPAAEDPQAVRLAQRAAPMAQMLRRSLAEKADLVWGV